MFDETQIIIFLQTKTRFIWSLVWRYNNIFALKSFW